LPPSPSRRFSSFSCCMRQPNSEFRVPSASFRELVTLSPAASRVCTQGSRAILSAPKPPRCLVSLLHSQPKAVNSPVPAP
jgi:hypothetical protein